MVTPTDAAAEENIEKQDAHQSPPEEPSAEIPQPTQAQEEYEAQFLLEPEQPHPVTTISLFSDPTRFLLASIHESTLYLAEQLQGTLWLDANGDGKRGSEVDSTLNAMEYGTGIGGG